MSIVGLNLFDIYNLLPKEFTRTTQKKTIKSIRIKNRADDMNFDFFVVRSYRTETT